MYRMEHLSTCWTTTMEDRFPWMISGGASKWIDSNRRVWIRIVMTLERQEGHYEEFSMDTGETEARVLMESLARALSQDYRPVKSPSRSPFEQRPARRSLPRPLPD